MAEPLILRVNMGGGIVVGAPHVVVCTGVGSCVVLALYDNRSKIGGLAHIMLPDSIVFRLRRFSPLRAGVLKLEAGEPGEPCPKGGNSGAGTKNGGSEILRSVYQCADTAVAALLQGMICSGVALRNIVAMVAGGARMFSDYGGLEESSIGEKNALAIKHLLKVERIPLVSCDIGGRYGRTIEFHLDSGRMVVKTICIEDPEV